MLSNQIQATRKELLSKECTTEFNVDSEVANTCTR